MEDGGIARWAKAVGDRVDAGDVIAEVKRISISISITITIPIHVQIETDKATVDFECVDDGFVAKILVPEGTSGVKVGTNIAILVEDETDIGAFENYSDGDGAANTGAAPSPDVAVQPEPAASPTSQLPADCMISSKLYHNRYPHPHPYLHPRHHLHPHHSCSTRI